jgi:ribosomal protein L16 Arg81 hydroxylase
MNELVSIIELLFPGTGLARFLFESYPDVVHASHGPLTRLPWAETMPSELVALLDRLGPRTKALVYEPDAHGVLRQQPVGIEEARAAYQRGISVSVEAGDAIFETLDVINRAIVLELGLPSVVPPALILSPRGARVPMHFDGLELLVLQLFGSKSWSLSPNSAIAHPDFPFFPSEGGAGPRGGSVSRIASSELPDQMPASAEACAMGPGSALFIPRGTWHATVADSDSVNAVFRLATPMAASIVARAIEQHLRRSPRWRKPIVGAAGHHGLRRLAAMRLRPLLEALEHDLPGATPRTAEAALSVYSGSELEVREDDDHQPEEMDQG